MYRSPAALALATLLASCSPGASSSSDASAGDAGGDGAPADLGPACSHTVPCTDKAILELNLFSKTSRRTIQNTADGSGFHSQVDATGGGFTPTESFVYARFTETGLVRVDVSDEAAFDSTDWDIAFRRFVVRLNSGVSGPSCVTGAALPDGTDYDSLASAPDGLSYSEEAYFDVESQCKLVTDDSGLNAPGTVMQDYWHYTNCVQMTGRVYVIRRADGRRVKLTIVAFYAGDAQATCDSTGTVPGGTTGGQVQVRWALLDR